MEAAIETLAPQLSEGHTEAFQQFLAFYSRFWAYSIRNSLLNHQQWPGATRCAGLKLWNSKGYTVRRGEKAIWIWAPILKPEEDPETLESIKTVVGFIQARVFDASQLAEIEARPLPTAFPVLPDDAEDAYRLCVSRIEASGVRVGDWDRRAAAKERRSYSVS